MVNSAKTTDVLDLFQQMRVELKEKIEISKGVILHYAPVSDHEYWDYNLLPEVCTLYSSFLHLDAFLEQRIEKMVEAGDVSGKVLTKADINFLSTFSKTAKVLESSLANWNISFYYI